MFRLVFEELAFRASKLPFGSNDHELIRTLQSKQILTVTNSWNYLQWDSKEKTLKPAARDPLPSEEAATLIQKIHNLVAQPDLIHRFSALKPMPQDSIVKFCDRALETRHLIEGPTGTGLIRCPTAIDRQRAYADDLCSNPTIDLAEVTIGSGNCNSLDEMRKAFWHSP